MKLKFNDETNKLGIVQGIDFEVNSNRATYSLADIARNVNLALNRFISVALTADSKWQFDDTNNTDAPVATADIVANQKDYTLDFDFLRITRVEVKDSNGVWRVIPQVDEREVHQSYGELQRDSGEPYAYDLRGKQIYFFQPSDTNVTGGLRIFFQRAGSDFTSSDTTKSPGVPETFHEYFVLYPALMYARKSVPEKVGYLTNEIEKMERAIIEHYQERNEVKKPRMTVLTHTRK